MSREGKITVLATGVFDGLHFAHREFLEKARAAGEYLIVGLENDRRVRELKGEGRPMFGQNERKRVIEKLQLADEVIILPDEMGKTEVYEELLAKIKPDILAVSTSSQNLMKKKRAMEKIGGEMIAVMTHKPDFSTTKMMEKINRRELKVADWEKLKQEILLLLVRGEIVVFPTDTVYGIIADATNEEAVEKVMRFKGRAKNKTVSVAVANTKMAAEYVEMDKHLLLMYQSKLPGDYTIISPLKKPTRLAKQVVTDKTVAVRIPDFPPLLELIGDFGVPLTITSANNSGARSAHSLGEMLAFLPQEQLMEAAMIVDAGELADNPPSTMIDVTQKELVIRKRSAHDSE